MLAAASMQDYLNPGKYLWQGPLLLAFGIVLIVGGAYLLRQKLRGQEKLRKRRLSWYMLVTFLSVLAAGALGGAITFMFTTIGKATESPWLMLAGLGIGCVVAIATIVLVIYAMVDLPFGVAARAAVTPLAGGIGLGIVVGLICFLPVRGIRTFEGQRDVCAFNLNVVARSIEDYQKKYDTMPQSLDTLVAQGMLEAKYLRCPVAPAAQAAYFYLPMAVSKNRVLPSQVQACDFLRNHESKGRNVLFVTGAIRWVDEDEFQDLMGKPENAAFAKAIAIAEAGGKSPAVSLPASSAPASKPAN